MKSICKTLAKRVSALALTAVMAAQTAFAALPQTTYAANNTETASAAEASNSRIEAVCTDYLPQVISYTDPISGFIHPGVGVTRQILENVRAQVRNGAEPWKSYFETTLLDNPGVSSRENMEPSWSSGKTLNSQGDNSAFRSDASKAYAQAVMYFITGDNAYRKNALSIIRAYEENDPESMAYFTDACIHTGIPTYRICIAAEILRCSTYQITNGYTEGDLAWTNGDTEKFISNFISPNIEVFQSSPDRFMNQHNYTNIGVMSAALFMDDREGYEKAVEWFTVNRSAYNQGYNGSILRLFREIRTLDEVGQKEGTGTPLAAPVIQHMEMGRDQAHGCGDLTNAAIMSRLMLAQGTKVDPSAGTVSTASNAVDCYAYLDNRLIKTADFFFEYMLGYDAKWTTAAFATQPDGTIKDVYASFSADYRGRYDTINFWDYYAYYRYTRGMSPEQIKTEYPYFYEGYQQLKYAAWNNDDSGGDFWLFLPAAAAGDTSFIPKSPANKADETVFEVENRGNVVSGNKRDVPLTTEGGVTYFHISRSAGGVKIAMNTAATTSDTLLFRVRTDGVAKLTMSGGPVGTIYLPDTNNSWVNVTYNRSGNDVLTQDTNMYWFTVSDLEGSYVDVDSINTAPAAKLAFDSGREDFHADTYAGAAFRMSFSASSAAGYSLVNAPTGASVDASGTVTWTPGSGDTGEHTFYVQAATGAGDIIALKKVVLTVSADRAAAVASACRAYDASAVYTTSSKAAYDAALTAANEATDADFPGKLSELSVAVASLELVSPPLLNDTLTRDEIDKGNPSLDFSKMNVGPNDTIKGAVSNLLDGETGSRLPESSVPFIMDFGFDYKVSVTRFGMQARAGFSNRLAGMNIYGSNDMANWDRLTVSEAAFTQAYQTVDVDPQFRDTQYRYLKFQQDTCYPDVLQDRIEPQNFQFGELRIWGVRHETGNPIESITISSADAEGGRIQAGNTVTATIQGRAALNGLSVQIHGVEAAVTAGAGSTYTATAAMPADSRTGNVSVQVACRSENGSTITINGTTDGSSLLFIDPSGYIDTGELAAGITSNCDPGIPEWTREQNAGYLFDNDLKTYADLNRDDGYYIVDFGRGVTVNLKEAMFMPRSELPPHNNTPRLNGMVVYGSNDTAEEKNWTKLTTAVTGAARNTWSYVSSLDSETGYRFFKLDGAQRGNAVEVEFYGTYNVAGIGEIAAQITSLPVQEATQKTLAYSAIPEGITITVKSSDPAGIVAEDGTITTPTTDTDVKLVLTLEDKDGKTADTQEITVTFKGLKSLLTAPTYRKGAAALTLPTVAGYTVTVTESSNTAVVATGEGTVTRPTAETAVTVKLGLVDSENKTVVESDAFRVIIPASEPKVDVNTQAKTITASSNRNDTPSANQMAALLFDGKTGTFGDLIDNDYFYIIDFGAGKGVKPAEFQMYPRTDQNCSLANRMNGTTISGSNDYSNWTQITDAVSGVSTDNADWKNVALRSGVTIPEEGYRYLRINCAGSSYGNIAEVEIFGTVIDAGTQVKPVDLTNKITVSPDGSSADVNKMIDGKFDTMASLTDTSAYFTIDFGEGKAITPTEFHLAPRSDAANENASRNNLSAMNGTTIYGSNQGKTWTKIAALESAAKYGWNVVKVNGEPSYRYLKVANTNGVALSEIEIYGTVGMGTSEPDPEPPEEEKPLDVKTLAATMTANNSRTNNYTAVEAAQRLFDGDTSTYGDLTAKEAGCPYYIDFGAGKAVNPTKFRLYPRADQLNRLNNTVISGSNDYTNWDEITDKVSGVNAAEWKDVALKSGTQIPEGGYRYLKISGADFGNIAEVQIYGTVSEVETQAKPVVLTADMIAVSPDDTTAETGNMFDGKFDTMASMTSFTIDFGENKAVTPTKFHLSPRCDTNNETTGSTYLSNMSGTTIYGAGSLDGEWTEIAKLESGAKYGWNVVAMSGTSQSYRYLKVDNETNGVALSEIEIYGTVSTAGNS